MKEILFKQDEADYIIKLLEGETSSIAKRIISRLKNAQKKIKVSSAKGKGRNLQYWVCEKIADMFGIKFDQQDDSCPIHSREMGLNGVDVILIDDIHYYNNNLKKHSILEIERLVDSIKNDGFLFPVAIGKLDGTNYIIDGEASV